MKFLGRGSLVFSGRPRTGAQLPTALENCTAHVKAVVTGEENTNPLAPCVNISLWVPVLLGAIEPWV